MTILSPKTLNPFIDLLREEGFISAISEEETEEERKRREEEERIRAAEEAEEERIRVEEERIRVEAEATKKEEIKSQQGPQEKQEQQNFISFLKENYSSQEQPTVDYPVPFKDTERERLPAAKINQQGSAFLLRRRLALGAAQEPTIAGNIYRLGKARWQSFMGDKTYKQAAREIEAIRQKEIAEKFPEIYGTEDAAVLMGRMGVAIADPVTLLIPWFKIAKAGKLATTLAGSAVAGTDIALRDEALYGGTNPASVGLAMALGGTSSYISSLFSPFSRKATTETVEMVGSTGQRVSKKVKFDEKDVNFNPLGKQVEMFEDLAEEGFIKNSKIIENILDHSENAGLLYNQKNILKAEKQFLQDDLIKIKEEIITIGDTPLRRTAKAQMEQQLSDKNKILSKLEIELQDVIIKRMPENFAEIGYTSLVAGLKKGVLTKDFASALMQETVRPLIGMIGGFAYGVTTADEDDTMTYVYTMMGLGATLGLIQKKIQVSDYVIKKDQQYIVKRFIETGEDLYRRTLLTTLKRLTAGTHSAKLQAGVEAVRDFGARMFKIQGAGIKTGVVIKDSVEESKQHAINYWTSVALPQIIGDTPISTVMAAGRLVNQKGMPITAKHSFLKEGDLENVAAEKLAHKIINITDEFKKYTQGVGITLKEEDFYGLTQLLKNPTQIRKFRTDLEEAFKIQFLNDHQKGKLLPRKGKWIHVDDIGKEGRIRIFTKEELEDALENGPLFEEWAKKRADAYIKGASQERKRSLWAFEENASINDHLTKPMFKARGGEEEKLIITAARHFENERVLYDQEARAFMSSKGFFEDDPINTLETLFRQTIPVVEFSRTFGSKGEGIRRVFKNIKSQIITDPDNNSLNELAKTQIKDVKDSIDAYFGLYGQVDNAWYNKNGAKTTVAILQAVLSSTKLTKVALPSLGDLIQTYKNSGFKASGLAAIRRFKKDNYLASGNLGLKAKRPLEMLEKEAYRDVIWSTRRYNDVLEREMKSWMIEASPNSLIQKTAHEYQRRFFEIVQLGRITRFAREFAFDAGAIRAWQIGKKIGQTGKVSRTLKKEIHHQLGLEIDDVRYLSKFKTMDDIQGDALGERFIIRAGMKTADRDALIPTVGNRRLFSQTRDPGMRFLGSFLSWAQAKSSQTNALVSRLEHGDIALGFRMLAALPVFGAVRWAQLQLNPSKELKKDSIVSESKYIRNELKQLGDTVIFSMEVMPWYLDKFVNEQRYDYGNTPVSGLAPVLELMDDFVSSALGGMTTDTKERQKAIYGRKGLLGTTIPFYKDFEKWLDIQKRMQGEYAYYGEDFEEKTDYPVFEKENFFKGGAVSEDYPVPNVIKDPSERINPYTGQPYDAEMERLGLAEGSLSAREQRIAEREERDRIRKEKEQAIIKGLEENLNPLQKASLIPVPIASDIAGVAGDIQMYRENPETKTLGNYALTGLGALPFVPSVAGKLKHIKKPLMGMPMHHIKDSTTYSVKFHGSGKGKGRELIEQPNYHVGRIDVDDFLKITTDNPKQMDRILEESKRVYGRYDPKKLNPEGLIYQTAYPYLKIDSTGRHLSHEGRHRASLVKQRGGKTIPIIIEGTGKINPNIHPSKHTLQDMGIKNLKGDWSSASIDSVDFAPVIRGDYHWTDAPEIRKKQLEKAYELVNRIKRTKKKTGGSIKNKLQYREAKREGGTIRNYRKEYDNYHSSDKQKKDRAHRNNANRQFKRDGKITAGSGKDVDHKDGNPRNNSSSNLRVKNKESNRSFSRRLKARSGGSSTIKKAIQKYFNIKELKDEIRQREGFKEKAYKLPNEEHYTIGYGFYGPEVKKDAVITKEEAEKRLHKEIVTRLETLDKLIPDAKNFNPSAQRAIFSEHYRGSIAQSPKTVELINNQQYIKAAEEFLNNEQYINAEKLGIKGIRPRMEAVNKELINMSPRYQKSMETLFNNITPF